MIKIENIILLFVCPFEIMSNRTFYFYLLYYKYKKTDNK